MPEATLIFSYCRYLKLSKQKTCIKDAIIVVVDFLHHECPSWAQYHQRFTYSFYARRSRMAKKTVKSAVSFGALGTYERKSCT